MKNILIAIALIAVSSNAALAGEKISKHTATPTHQAAKAPKRPVLDTTTTGTIKKSPVVDQASKPKAERLRSGIEINPWFMPN